MPHKIGKDAPDERVIQEYPRSTRWLEGTRILGTGNLILTNRRLVFLHAIEPTPEQMANIQKMAGAATEASVDFALTLHKKNFEIPLRNITRARTGVFAWVPFPRFCLRVDYLEGKKEIPRTASFQFTISLLQGFVRMELTTVLGWAMAIGGAVKRAQKKEGPF